jgi:mannose/cellobiose epimerase-like protein (N-acyl-D-glucosamine 2-epimerase family)
MIYFEELQEPDPYIPPGVNNLKQISVTSDTINLVEENPEAYFPNFLHYSISVANALVDYLYDTESGGFYRSVNQYWSNNSINELKYAYDQAQAILALLKLSDAVINDSERDFALHTAEMTYNYMITHLYDDKIGGFFTYTGTSYKKPGTNGKVIQALLDLYSTTSNMTYRDKAVETFEFIDDSGWDTNKGGYFYLLSHSGVVASSNPSSADLYYPKSKKVDHNIIMGEALLKLYTIDPDPKYLSRAIEIYKIINTTCRNYTTGLFYTGFDRDGIIVEPEKTDIFINSLVLEFLSQLYNSTGNEVYYEDFLSLINAVLFNFWDSTNGGFYATYSYNDQVERDKKKYSERQFYAIRALDEAYKLTKSNLYYNLILDSMEFLNNMLYDNEHEGYYVVGNEDGSIGEEFWKDKYSVTQALAIYELANLWLYSKPGVINAVWSPSSPRPEDDVTIMVAAFDVDGLSNVLFNYSLNNQPYKLLEMVPNALIGNMFEIALSSRPHGTTVNFNIIVNDTFGNEAVRESYFFTWEVDELPPHVMLIGMDPGNEIPVTTNFSIIVSAHDNPSQGVVSSIRMYYHVTGQSSEKSRALIQLDKNIWIVGFPDGIIEPNNYDYYFEAIDERGNFGYSSVFQFYVQGDLENVPLNLIIIGFFFFLIVIPGFLYVYVRNEKKGARRTLRNMRKTQKKKRGTRGTRRMKKNMVN